MGILADHHKEVSAAITEKAQEIAPARPVQQAVSAVEAPNSRPSMVLPKYDPIQTVQTKNRVATADLQNFSDRPMTLKIIPMVSTEVYAVDVVNEQGDIVYSVNAHSGQFDGRLPLPKGKYRCFVKTMKDEMPITVSQE